MAVHDKYCLLTRHNLRQQIDIQLSQKQKDFYRFFFILKIYVKFWPFSNKNHTHIWCVSEIMDPEKRGLLIV